MSKISIALQNGGVQDKVEEIAIRLAKDVASEDPAAEAHWQRVRLAYAVLTGRAGLIERLTRIVLTSDTIAAKVGDADDFMNDAKLSGEIIANELSGIWTMYATAMFGEAPVA